MYAFQLPVDIPPPGDPGGPPLPSQMRQMAGAPGNRDPRALFRELCNHPDRIPGVIQEFRKGLTNRRN